MFNRKELKRKAKEIIKRNYWNSIIVCFLLAILTGEFGVSITGIWQSNDTISPNFIENNFLNNVPSESLNNEDNKNETIFDESFKDKKMTKTEKKIIETLDASLNSFTKSQKFIYRIYDAVKAFNIDKNELATIICTISVIAVLFMIFIANPLIVGGKKYFINAKNGNDAKIRNLIDVFKKDYWLNISIIMLFKLIYNMLWYLTIIGGIIKSYEYRMIPYILAEDPKIKRREAFLKSKKMMKGKKWNTFVLDLSFIGWNIVSVVFFGIPGLLWVNPYYAATNAELYEELKDVK